MKRRSFRILIEFICGFLIGMSLLVGIGVWRLSSGPVSIGILTPTITEALRDQLRGYDIQVGDTELTWAGWDRALDIVARDVRLAPEGQSTLAVLPRISIGISLIDTLKGEVRLDSIDILNPTVRLVLREDRTLALSLPKVDGGETGAAPPEPSPPEPSPPEPSPVEPDPPGTTQELARLDLSREQAEGAIIPGDVLDVLLPRAEGGVDSEPLGGLSRVSLSGGTLIFIDEAFGDVWSMSDAFALFARDEKGLDAAFSGTLVGLDADIGLNAGLSVTNRRAALNGENGNGENGNGDGEIRVTLDLDRVPGVVVRKYLPDYAQDIPDLTANVDGEFLFDGRGVPLTGSTDIRTDYGNIRVDAARDPISGEIAGSAALDRVEPARLAMMSGRLAPLAPLNATMGMTGDFELSSDLRPLKVAAEMTMGPGIVDLPDFYPDGLAVLGADARLQWDADLRRVAVNHLRVDLGKPVLMATGEVILGDAFLAPSPQMQLDPGNGPDAVSDDASEEGSQEARDTMITLDAMALDVPLERLEELWPRGVASGGRDWMTSNMNEGTVPQADITLRARLPGDDPDRMIVEDIHGGMELVDGVVNYLEPLTPATGVTGFATFNEDGLNIEVTGGNVDDIAVKSGRILLRDLDKPVERIEIELDLSGSLGTAFALLDTEPRRYISKIGLDAKSVEGTADARVSFALPLLNDLKAEQIHYSADGVLSDLRIYRRDLDMTITAAEVPISLDPSGLEVSGLIGIDDIPADVAWRENFDAREPVTRRLSLKTAMAPATLAQYGLPLADYASGQMGIDLVLTQENTGDMAVDLVSDLTDTEIEVEEIAWRKAAGVEGRLSLSVAIPEEGIPTLGDVRLQGGGVKMEGSARFERGFEELRDATIGIFEMGRTRLSGEVVARSDGEGYSIALAGPMLDLASFFEEEEEPVEDTGNLLGEALEEEPGTPFDLNATIDRIVDGEGWSIENANIFARHDGLGLDEAVLRANVGEGRRIDLSFRPNGTGGHRIDGIAADAGAVLSAADITHRVRGGTLVVAAERPSRDAPFEGTINVEEFRLVRAPGLAKILEFFSLTGMLSALAESGIDFDRAFLPFTYGGDVLTLDKAFVRGPSIALTLNGTVNTETDELDITGTVAPADLISKVVGSVPIIGDLLTGGENKGLFASNYALRGPANDPDVSVNPLSTLPLGPLKQIFSADQIKPGEGGADDATRKSGNR